MQVNFDASNHQPQTFDPLPAGWYKMFIVEGLEKPAKKQGNSYYAAVFEIADGPFKGRKLFHNFNFVNDNDQAVKIAYDQLATICHAVGKLKISQMDDLFNQVLLGKVKIRPAQMEDDGVTEKYEAQNEIKGFKPNEDAVPGGIPTGAGGLPEGFGDATPAASTPAASAVASTPAESKPSAAPSIPSAATAATAAPAEPVKKLVMTAKAQGGTAEQFRAHDAAWTDDLLVKEGYAEWVIVEPEAPKVPSSPGVPSTPSTPAATAAPIAEVAQGAATANAAAEDDETPPWLQGQ